jgi:nucleoside-diphosphate-sugar epimerase
MRVVVVGATGNIGTSCLERLGEEQRVGQIVGIARRAPQASFAKTKFVELDVSRDALEPHMEGADIVVHLAWDLRPSHDTTALWRNNVEGSGTSPGRERAFRGRRIRLRRLPWKSSSISWSSSTLRSA